MKYQLLPSLTEQEYQSLKSDIAIRGIIVPIEFDEDGNVLDGHHRLRAWNELKREDGVFLPDHYPSVTRGGLSEEQKRNHVRALNIMRRHLTKDQREELWADMRKDGATYQQIADATGVDAATVWHSVIENSITHTDSSITQPTKVKGKDGKLYPPKKKRKKNEQPRPPAAPSVSIYANSSKEEDKARDKAKQMTETGSNGASQQTQVTMFSHESIEWYTPIEIIELARQVMGEIDLDPASSDEAQANIKARHHLTEKDDGLSLPWFGNVFLNPPYSKTNGRSNQEIWAEKLTAEYQKAHVTEAILLVKSALGYKWFEELWDNWPVCFVRRRLSFIKSNGDDEGESKQGTALFYIGNSLPKFIDAFSQLGRITTPDGHYIPKKD